MGALLAYIKPSVCTEYNQVAAKVRLTESDAISRPLSAFSGLCCHASPIHVPSVCSSQFNFITSSCIDSHIQHLCFRAGWPHLWCKVPGKQELSYSIWGKSKISPSQAIGDIIRVLGLRSEWSKSEATVHKAIIYQSDMPNGQPGTDQVRSGGDQSDQEARNVETWEQEQGAGEINVVTPANLVCTCAVFIWLWHDILFHQLSLLHHLFQLGRMLHLSCAFLFNTWSHHWYLLRLKNTHCCLW